MKDFFCFFIWSFFFHFIAFGVSLSGLGYNWFFLFFDLGLLFPFHYLWIRSVGLRLWWIFFLFFDLEFLLPFYCLWLKSVGFRLGWIFLFFGLELLFPFHYLWIRSVGFRLWWIFFFVFWFGVSFSISLPLD